MTETLLSIITVYDENGNKQQHYYSTELPREILLGKNASKIQIRWFKEV